LVYLRLCLLSLTWFGRMEWRLVARQRHSLALRDLYLIPEVNDLLVVSFFRFVALGRVFVFVVEDGPFEWHVLIGLSGNVRTRRLLSPSLTLFFDLVWILST
jgi:hypothetical protein